MSRDMKREIARVESADIVHQRGMFLTATIHFEYECGGQGFCPVLDEYDKAKERRVGTAFAADVIKRLMDVFGVESFSDIKGKIVWVTHDHGSVTKIETTGWDGRRVFDLHEIMKEWGIPTE